MDERLPVETNQGSKMPMDSQPVQSWDLHVQKENN